MSMTFINQLGVIPALLVVLPGMLILHGQENDRSKRRFLLYSLGMGTLLLLALLITKRFITEPYEQPFFQLSNLMAPSIMGMIALSLLNIKAIAGMSGQLKMVVILLFVAMAALFGLLWNSQLGIGYLIVPGVLILAIGWTLGKRFGWLTTILSLLSLVIFYLFIQLINHPPDYSNNPPSRLAGVLGLTAAYLIPGLSVVLSGLLIASSLQPMSEQSGSISWKGFKWIKIGLACLLLLSLAYTIFWGSVWDQTSDGLTGIFMMHPSALVAIGVGMMMILAFSGKNRLTGVLYLIIVPTLIYQTFELGWRVSYHEMTEKRADRIAQALERFQAREGYYPVSLDALSPRDLLFIQQPVILAGESWCYEGGTDYFRLSAFYREFFSAPVSLHVYASTGKPPSSSVCEVRLDEMKKKYYSPMEDPNAMQPPVPTPQPENEVGLPKASVQPLLNETSVIPGSWSPDSSYFVFAAQANGFTFQFLNGKTGEVCSSDERFAGDTLRSHHVWLPDGRLLYIGNSGIEILKPCQSEGESLESRFPISFKQIASVSRGGERALLQSEDAYWILDIHTLTVVPIPDVTPVSYELHWDQSSWLPGGEVLAISRLNGRKDSKAGSTLYLIDGGTGKVLNSITLKGEFGQSAPWIEILNDHELIVNGIGEWQLVDFSVTPPATTNVLANIFGVDVKFPDEIAAWGSFVEPDGDGYYLAVRLNHPRNQATYLYDSKSKQVHVYNHEFHTLLVLPTGYLLEMPKLEITPTYRDEYDIVFVDRPEIIQPHLKLEGHTPREYPHLSLAYIEESSELAVASEQGISLVSLPNGEMDAYWELLGSGYSPWIMAAPNGSALMASKDYGGLYFIPLSSTK
jgi:hypothetical protein